MKRGLVLALVFAMGASACSPGTVTPRASARCSAAEIDRFLADCVDGSALVIHCQQFASTHASCNECLRPASGAGPVLEHAGGVEANLDACRKLHAGACERVDAGDSLATLRAVSLAFCGR